MQKILASEGQLALVGLNDGSTPIGTFKQIDLLNLGPSFVVLHSFGFITTDNQTGTFQGTYTKVPPGHEGLVIDRKTYWEWRTLTEMNNKELWQLLDALPERFLRVEVLTDLGDMTLACPLSVHTSQGQTLFYELPAGAPL